MLEELTRRALEAQPFSVADAAALLAVKDADLPGLLAAADEIKRAHFGSTLALCSIANARSGRCAQDCAFCAQSAHHSTQAPVYSFAGPERVADAARRAKAAGVRRFAVVISGSGPQTDEFEAILAAVRAIRHLDLEADASLGVLTRDQLAALKHAGLTRLHHNLETARSFFPSICTTRSYEDDVDTIRAALDLDIAVCCGGLFGLGENWDQRLELARTLRELGVSSVPINFLTPIPGTPLQHARVLSPEEALAIVAVYRFVLPRAHLRICGGREAVFGHRRAELLTSGASGLMVGDYLTTAGSPLERDLADIARLGLTVV